MLPRLVSYRSVSQQRFCVQCFHPAAALTVGLCADEAGGGAVKEGEEARHGQADVRVGRPQVQSGEPGEVDLQDVLWSHLNIGHLHRDQTTVGWI